MRRRLIAGLVVAVLALPVAGCSTGQGSATRAPSATARAGASSTAPAATTSARGLCVAETGPDGCPVAPGHYAVPQFHPAIEFDTPDRWTNNAQQRDVVAFATPGRMDEFLELGSNITQGRDDDGKTVPIGNTPEGFVAWLRTREALTVDKPVSATLGGKPATSIDAVAKKDTVLYRYTSGGEYGLARGQRIRFVTAVVGRDRVQVAVEAPDKRFDAFWKRIGPILESVTFVGG